MSPACSCDQLSKKRSVAILPSEVASMGLVVDGTKRRLLTQRRLPYRTDETVDPSYTNIGNPLNRSET
jgi:hypothetical protein